MVLAYSVHLPNDNELSTYFAVKYGALPLRAIKQKGCKMCHSINFKQNPFPNVALKPEHGGYYKSEGIKSNFHLYKGAEGHFPATHTLSIGLNLPI